ncbi:MAG: hypothetical protein Q9163_005803 [Psora crenata]
MFDEEQGSAALPYGAAQPSLTDDHHKTVPAPNPANMAVSIPSSSDIANMQASVVSDSDSTSQATTQAMKMLHTVLHKYMPLHREPGKHVFRGVELVVHEHKDKPFNAIGYIVMAAQMLEAWEKVVGDEYKRKIEEPNQPKAMSARNAQRVLDKAPLKAQEMIKATHPHKPLSQPVADALTLPKGKQKPERWVTFGGGVIFIRKQYVRRLELENAVYRQHLHELERDIYSNVLTDITDVLGLERNSTNGNADGIFKPAGNVTSQQKSGRKGNPLSRAGGNQRTSKTALQTKKPRPEHVKQLTPHPAQSSSRHDGAHITSANKQRAGTSLHQAAPALPPPSSTSGGGGVNKRKTAMVQDVTPPSAKRLKGDERTESEKENTTAPARDGHGTTAIPESSADRCVAGDIVDLTKDMN